MPSLPEALPLPGLLELACEPGKMREEVVDPAQVGMRAGWDAQKLDLEFDLTVVVQGKMRCDLVRVPEGAGQAEVHDRFLEPRLERAVDIRFYGFRFICVVEPAVPVTLFAAAVWPRVTVVGPGQVLLELEIVVLQPEDFELERVALVLERLVFAAKLEQAHIEEHLAHGRKPFSALHPS